MRRNDSIATSFATACFLMLFGALGQAQAETAGKVLNLSGPLFSVKSDGARRVMSVGSGVEQGDMLITEEKTYARVKFSDASEITLRPNTQFKVENYAFAQNEPKKDNAVFSLFKGALRAISGLVGKRGNQDAYRMSTPTATIGIRGTRYIVEYVPEAEPTAVSRVPYALPLLALAEDWERGSTLSDVPSGLFSLSEPIQLAQSGPPQMPGAGGRRPGLYVQVIDGIVQLSNSGGTQQFGAGQFGFTGSPLQPPVIIPQNPGIQFDPPPSFGGGTPGPQGQGQPGQRNSAAGAECEVR